MDKDKITAELAPNIARGISRVARQATNEADFRREAARILEDAGLMVGLTIIPRDEFSVARGRVDSVYNRLILEYKRPGIIKNSNATTANQTVIKQVKDYIIDVAKREKREAQRLAGVATDGYYFIFVRRVGEGWSVDDPLAVNSASTELFLRLLFSLSTGAALVPENLVDDFGPKNIRAQRAVRALYTALHGAKHPLVEKLFEQWRLFFSEATDYKEWSGKIESKSEFRSFVSSLWTKEQIKHLDAAKVFFVLHTYYALLIKLVASLAAARFAGGIPTPLSSLASKKGDDLKQSMVSLERGGLFREYGIRNFLEGDFFGWYLPAWNEEIEDAVSDLIKRLADYDPGTLELAPENARDLLKKLYHYLLPREIRHDLGEYYTPDWLAERLIIQTLGKRDLGDSMKRVLDPSCGSGTFLVILIKYIRERATQEKRGDSETLGLILKNIIGIDLNPLAVIAARTNYLLALGDLLKARKGDIDIPVYQADSILTPSRGEGLFDGNVYSLKTSVGIFKIPTIFTSHEKMDILADILDECVESSVSSQSFLVRLEKVIPLTSQEGLEVKLGLKNLYRQLQELHDQGLNGVWARIIKNSFAPLFLDPCNFIVGNPPWVNWESLPDEYRMQTKPLWEQYGLFPHGGMDTILGKGKKDIAMLMTYVSIDRYLEMGGRLGFVLPQNLFKTSGAGQGFRRFILPKDIQFAPLVVEDMVKLKPFEGATNRTAVVVFVKGKKVSYPLSYQCWERVLSGRGGSIGFDTPYEEVTKEKITFHVWQAEPINRDDPTSAWLTARPRALKVMQKVLGKSDYIAHEGCNTGGANSIFWVEISDKRPDGRIIVSNIVEGAKKKAASIQAAVETDLIYPLLRGRDLERWNSSPSIHVLFTQDAIKRKGINSADMETKYPSLHAYLKKFEEQLRDRAAFNRYYKPTDPFWSMFNVGQYTLSEYKVGWRYIDSDFRCAVIAPVRDKILGHKVVIPDHRVITVSVDDKLSAHYLCGLLNSSVIRLTVKRYVVGTQIAPHILENIKVPKFQKSQQSHCKIAYLSELAHEAALKSDTQSIKNIEEQIDQRVAKMWDFNEADLQEIKKSLEEM